MEFAELAGIRQSVRSYSGKAVEEEKLMQCIETARLSPSANNSQPWRFVVVDEPELRDRIADAAAGMGMNKFVRQAPVIIAVVLEKQNMLSAVGSVIQDKEYRLLDIGIAANQRLPAGGRARTRHLHGGMVRRKQGKTTSRSGQKAPDTAADNARLFRYPGTAESPQAVRRDIRPQPILTRPNVRPTAVPPNG